MKKFLPLHPQTRNNTSGHKKFSKSKKKLTKNLQDSKIVLNFAKSFGKTEGERKREH